jgi:hypothetical protein
MYLEHLYDMYLVVWIVYYGCGTTIFGVDRLVWLWMLIYVCWNVLFGVGIFLVLNLFILLFKCRDI